MQSLLEFYSSEGNERLGFILHDGSVVEVKNLCNEPGRGGIVDPTFLVENEDRLAASFHTHPGASSNLSGDDYQAFKNWPDLKHYIVGNDGVRCFVVRNGAVVHAS